MYSGVSEKLSQSGTVGVIPVDTVYGLVARANDEAAVKRLYKLKNRDNKPGTLIAASIDQLVDLGLKRRYLKAVEQFWPGALSVIIPLPEDSLFYLHQGQKSLAVRIPEGDDLNRLLRASGPLLTSSANLPSLPPANNIKEAKAYFKDKVDFYIDGGDYSHHLPSTIIQIIDDAINVLRQGSVKIDDGTI